MRQASFAQFTCVSIAVSNLLEARMIITSYNQHVRLLSSEPFGWFAPPKFTRPWGPTFVYGIITLKTPESALWPRLCPLKCYRDRGRTPTRLRGSVYGNGLLRWSTKGHCQFQRPTTLLRLHF